MFRHFYLRCRSNSIFLKTKGPWCAFTSKTRLTGVNRYSTWTLQPGGDESSRQLNGSVQSGLNVRWSTTVTREDTQAHVTVTIPRTTLTVAVSRPFFNRSRQPTFTVLYYISTAGDKTNAKRIDDRTSARRFTTTGVAHRCRTAAIHFVRDNTRTHDGCVFVMDNTRVSSFSWPRRTFGPVVVRRSLLLLLLLLSLRQWRPPFGLLLTVRVTTSIWN